MSQVTFELVSEAQGRRWQLAIDRARLMGAASRAEAFRIVEAELWLLDLELPEHEIRRLATTLGRLRLDQPGPMPIRLQVEDRRVAIPRPRPRRAARPLVDRSLADELVQRVQGGHHLIALFYNEPNSALQGARGAASQLELSYHHWSHATRFDPPLGEEDTDLLGAGIQAPEQAMEMMLRASTGQHLIVLEDFHHFWDLEAIQAYLKQLARSGANGQPADVVVVLAPPTDIPEELASSFDSLHQKIVSTTTPFLDRFGRDLTQEALEGKIERAVGRDNEVNQVVQIFHRRRKNNPLLVGDPGVGKTAVVEELAHRIVQNEVPSRLQGKRIVEIRLTDLVSDTTLRGQFEERMKRLLDEAQAGGDTILFIDEFHSVMQAGRGEGGMSAADTLKPALARLPLPVIGATTLAEYRQIEKDAAFTRRFERVLINEPDRETALAMVRSQVSPIQHAHRITITPDACDAAVRWADQYLSGHLPDTAITLLDDAASAVEAWGGDKVDEHAVAREIQKRTGVSLGTLVEAAPLATAEAEIRARVVGQEHAVEAIIASLRLNRVRPAPRPISLLFCGPTGVGKTELAKAVADAAFGSQDALVRLDMSEYQQEHQVARLIGAPPGYVSHEEGGQLTEKVFHRPSSVILLDEIEKAHPKVLDTLLQILDDGRLTDGHGKTVDFRNTFIIMTSNLFGAEKRPVGFTAGSETTDRYAREAEAEERRLRRALTRHLRPELVNRLDWVLRFRPLTQDELLRIVDIQLRSVRSWMEEEYSVSLSVTEQAKIELAEAGYDPDFGARPLRRIIQREVEVPLAERLLATRPRPGGRIVLDYSNDEFIWRTSR